MQVASVFETAFILVEGEVVMHGLEGGREVLDGMLRFMSGYGSMR